MIFQGNQTNILKEQPIQEQPAHQEQVHIEPIAEAKGIWRSKIIWKLAIFSDYIVYHLEFDFDTGPKDDPTLFYQAISEDNLTLWYDTMKEEMESMTKNQV